MSGFDEGSTAVAVSATEGTTSILSAVVETKENTVKKDEVVDEEDDDDEDDVEGDDTAVTGDKKKKKKKKGKKKKKPAAVLGSKLPLSRCLLGFTDSYTRYGQTDPPTRLVSELFPTGTSAILNFITFFCLLE